MTETIVKPPVNPSVKLLKEWGWLIAVLLIVAQQYGWLTADQIATIKRVIPVESKDTTTETITVETTTKPAKLVEPVVAKPVEVAAIKPEDIQQWVDLIRIVIDELKPKPAPVDPKPNPVDPLPVDPKPVDPTPQPPLPGDAKIVITDKNNTPITSPTIDAGKWFRLAVTGVTSDYTVTVVSGTTPNPEIGPSTNGKEFSGVLRTGEWLHVIVSGVGIPVPLQQRVSANHSPMPPPRPDVVPDVEPVEPVVTSKKLALEVVYEPKKITPSTAIVLNATDSWNSFIVGGHTWQFFDKSSPELMAKQAIADSAKTTLPTLCIYDVKTRWPIAAIPLPTSVDELKAVVRMYEGGAK